MENGATGMTKDDFASGKVAYLLQKGQDDPVWGQTLADEGGDPYPVLGGKTVYQNVTYSGCTEDTSFEIEYSNEEKDTKFTHALVKSEKVNADCENDGRKLTGHVQGVRNSLVMKKEQRNSTSFRLFQRLDMITKWTRKNQRMAQE